MKQGPGSLCQPCYCRTIPSLHLKWNKVSTVTISSQLPRESLYPRKLVGSCFCFVFAGVFLIPGKLLQVKPNSIPEQHPTQCGETQQPVPPVQLCQDISLCRQVLGRALRQSLAESSAQGSTSRITGMRCVPKPDIDGVVSNHEKTKLSVFFSYFCQKCAGKRYVV